MPGRLSLSVYFWGIVHFAHPLHEILSYNDLYNICSTKARKLCTQFPVSVSEESNKQSNAWILAYDG